MSRQKGTCPTLLRNKSHTLRLNGAPDRIWHLEPSSNMLNLKTVQHRFGTCRSVSTVPHFVLHC